MVNVNIWFVQAVKREERNERNERKGEGEIKEASKRVSNIERGNVEGLVRWIRRERVMEKWE